MRLIEGRIENGRMVCVSRYINYLVGSNRIVGMGLVYWLKLWRITISPARQLMGGLVKNI